MLKIKQIERGWQGHGFTPCRFHLNTLLEGEHGFKIVISTIGDYHPFHNPGIMERISYNRYYETIVAESFYVGCNEINITKPIDFENNWVYPQKNDLLPQAGHWVVVNEIKERMGKGEINKQPDESESQ